MHLPRRDDRGAEPRDDEGLEPARLIECRLDIEPPHDFRLAQDAVIVGDHSKTIAPRREVRIEGLATDAGGHPIAIESLELVLEMDFGLSVEAEPGVVDLYAQRQWRKSETVHRIDGLSIDDNALDEDRRDKTFRFGLARDP